MGFGLSSWVAVLGDVCRGWQHRCQTNLLWRSNSERCMVKFLRDKFIYIFISLSFPYQYICSYYLKISVWIWFPQNTRSEPYGIRIRAWLSINTIDKDWKRQCNRILHLQHALSLFSLLYILHPWHGESDAYKAKKETDSSVFKPLRSSSVSSWDNVLQNEKDS